MVDDELGIREGCRKILAAEGYEVVTAGDGKAGLEQFLERGPFAVLLVDLQMPRMSGLELMREARGRDPDIVPIIITAHATIDTAVEGTRQGPTATSPSRSRRTSFSWPSRTAWSGGRFPWRHGGCGKSGRSASWRWPRSAPAATPSSPR